MNQGDRLIMHACKQESSGRMSHIVEALSVQPLSSMNFYSIKSVGSAVALQKRQRYLRETNLSNDIIGNRR